MNELGLKAEYPFTPDRLVRIILTINVDITITLIKVIISLV